jgi:hypothetical protein
MKQISILLPTRGRKSTLLTSVKSLLDRISGIEHIEILFAVDQDDTEGMPYFIQHVCPYIEQLKIHHQILVCPSWGYSELHRYLNLLAEHAQGHWLFFWNDDAVMNTDQWDQEILKYNDQFRLLSVWTHNQHPYSIFPIVPKKWYDIVGHLSQHSLNDAWLSQIAYMLDIFQRIDIAVTHDRNDLTGNNNDQTYHRREILEGNPTDPRDFNHDSARQQRLNDAAKLATWMQDQGMDLSFFVAVCEGRQDPWAKARLNDPNRQLT